jgi:exodeoxyribonuclease III
MPHLGDSAEPSCSNVADLMQAPNLRITAWNCRSGPVHQRLSEVADLKPDIVFLQECKPGPVLPLDGDILLQTVNQHKGLALASINDRYTLERVERPGAPLSSIAAIARGPVTCLILGQWTHPPDYRAEIDQLVGAFSDLAAQMPTVLIGDLNTGAQLGNPSIKGGEVFDRLASLGFASAYHLHHSVGHGYEQHATYFHAITGHTPWHIDYCFVSKAWGDCVSGVEIGADEPWASRSDHRPLTVTLTVG